MQCSKRSNIHEYESTYKPNHIFIFNYPYQMNNIFVDFIIVLLLQFMTLFSKIDSAMLLFRG